jgi:enoyl-CoA hydratase
MGLVNLFLKQNCSIFVTELHKKSLRNSLGHKQCIKSINANYKDGENGFETEIKSFGKCFGTEDFKKEQLLF